MGARSGQMTELLSNVTNFLIILDNLKVLSIYCTFAIRESYAR